MKRIIICCDGTWGTPEASIPSNVIKTARAIRPVSPHGVEQVVFYDWGIGTQIGQALVGGALGRGIDKNICDAYRFLVHNYAPGDEVFLFGFSRGAYTVRSLLGMLRNCALLPKHLERRIPEAYEMYRSDDAVDSQEARMFRRGNHIVHVKFLGVWDTVGSLGLPVKFFRKNRYDFHDLELSSLVENAYQALAQDEDRRAFWPILWKTNPNRENTEQRWFPGQHSDVGGGSENIAASNKTFRWMLDKAKEAGISVDLAYEFSHKTGGIVKLKSFTLLHLLGRRERSPLATNHDESLS